MPGMRVHELAKEFDMTSKELLSRLAEMKIPAKSHASILQDAYVQKVRKNLEPEIKERAGQLEDEEAKKNQKVVEIKELKLRPMIDTHDYEVKIKQTKKFLKEGNKVKFTMRFKGREMNTSNLGQDVLHRILDDLEGLYKLDSEPKMEGRQMTMVIAPEK